jgi:amino acid transporter
MTLVAALSMAGCALLALVGGSRMLYAMSARRQIPAFLGALHPGFRTPLNASLLLGSIATALAIGGGYAELAAVSAGARMLVYLACCLACLRLPAVGTAARGRAVPLLTGAAIAVLLPGLERREVVAGMIGILIGPALYLAARRERRVLLPKEEGP